MMRTHKKGFTIMELMVVVAIMAIMAAIVVPYFNQYRIKSRLDGAARQVLSDLMAARMKAVNLNRTVTVAFSGNQYTIDSTGTPETRNIQTEFIDVTMSASGNPQFYAGGTAFGSTITLTNSSGSKKVSVASTGRVKIE